MKRAQILAAVLASSMIVHSAAASDESTTPPPKEQMSDAAENRAAQFIKDKLLLTVATQLVQSKGILALEPLTSDFSVALKSGIPVLQAFLLGNGKTIVLVDGIAHTLIAEMLLSKKLPPNSKLEVVTSPYPMLSLILASYYNEIKKPADAIDALDLGIALTDINKMRLGEMNSALLSEKGAALNALKRHDEALAVYESALTLHVLKNGDKARLYRGKGFSLEELGRLDEAEKAYHVSLACEPDNRNALNELKYIAQLRAGKPPEPGTLQSVAPVEDKGTENGQCPETM